MDRMDEKRNPRWLMPLLVYVAVLGTSVALAKPFLPVLPNWGGFHIAATAILLFGFLAFFPVYWLASRLRRQK